MRSRFLRRNRYAGFTMVELLTVIGIIIVLIGILVPLVTTVRKQAFVASTNSQINKLQAASQHYFTDFRAYPGPVADQNIKGFYSSMYVAPGTGVAPLILPGGAEVTSTQNLVLGLLGGLYYGGGPPPGIQYGAEFIGKGPKNLTLTNPQLFPPYVEFDAKYELANDGQGKLTSWTVANNPSGGKFIIPEFVDRFSNPAPIIYLRARAGGQEIVDNSDSQYFADELKMYWKGDNPTIPFPSRIDSSNNNTSVYPTATSFFQNPAIKDGRTPRGKDSFIMISAGYDGYYGTKDDLIYPNDK